MFSEPYLGGSVNRATTNARPKAAAPDPDDENAPPSNSILEGINTPETRKNFRVCVLYMIFIDVDLKFLPSHRSQEGESMRFITEARPDLDISQKLTGFTPPPRRLCLNPNKQATCPPRAEPAQARQRSSSSVSLQNFTPKL